VTRSASGAGTGAMGGRSGGAPIADEPWGAPAAASGAPAGGDVWNTPGSFSDDTPF